MEKIDEIVIKARAKTKKIMFIFHGYGANKENFLPVGSELSENIDSIEIHIFDGIEVTPDGSGRQWFPYDVSGKDQLKACLKNESKIRSHMDEILKKKNMSYDDVILCGFSQGATVSIDLGLRIGVFAIVAFSGYIMDTGIKISNEHTNLLMMHGRNDNVVPFSAFESSVEIIRNNGLGVTIAVDDKAEHYISQAMLISAWEFLNEII